MDESMDEQAVLKHLQHLECLQQLNNMIDGNVDFLIEMDSALDKLSEDVEQTLKDNSNEVMKNIAITLKEKISKYKKLIRETIDNVERSRQIQATLAQQ